MIRTFRRRYRTKPYSGDASSYWAMAPRASGAPPVPRASTSTTSREAYLSRNLDGAHQHLERQQREKKEASYQPPASARAAWYASATLAWSSPLRDMSAAAWRGRRGGVWQAPPCLEAPKAQRQAVDENCGRRFVVRELADCAALHRGIRWCQGRLARMNQTRISQTTMVCRPVLGGPSSDGGCRSEAKDVHWRSARHVFVCCVMARAS